MWHVVGMWLMCCLLFYFALLLKNPISPTRAPDYSHKLKFPNNDTNFWIMSTFALIVPLEQFLYIISVKK